MQKRGSRENEENDEERKGEEVGYDIQVQVWKCLGDSAQELVTKMYNVTWKVRDAVVVERQRYHTNVQEQR